MNLIEELRWRGMLQDITPGTEEQLLKERTTGYVGFDPTADSLHIGNLVPIILLVHLQRAGHKPLALVGGATGMVGDPSGKSAERNLLDESTLQHNVACIQRQLEQFLRFDPADPRGAELVNNYDWFKEINFLNFIRDVGKHISVNYMLSKDSVRKRLDAESGISFTEFTYQLIQGYDFYWLNQHKGCKLQMGGSDQWGNITTGTELIRRKGGGDSFAFTCPLITKADGSKFGKSEGGNIWLDPARTSPYKFYQFWINAADEDASKWIKVFTFLGEVEINALIKEHEADAGRKLLQKRLAIELTRFVHGEAGLEAALQTTEKLFDPNTPAENFSQSELEEMDGIQIVEYPAEKITAGSDIVSFLAETGILPSKGEARKMVQGGGISLNRRKAGSIDQTVDASFLLHGKYLLVQKGKKNFYLIRIVNGQS